MRLWTLHTAFPESRFWSIVAYNTTHVPWQGCSLHDLIQPAFSFLVGAAMPVSIASRRARGETFGRMLGHAVWRSVALMLLGIFLRSLERQQTYWTFEDTLTQIGLGYFVRSPLPRSARRPSCSWRSSAFWGAFALYPIRAQTDYTKVGVPADWPNLYSGFLHFNKNSNLSWAFDVWFLNLFPRNRSCSTPADGRPSACPGARNDDARHGLVSVEVAAHDSREAEGSVISGVALTFAGLLLQWLHINDRETDLDLSYTRHGG
jgi:hypothetical protein